MDYKSSLCVREWLGCQYPNNKPWLTSTRHNLQIIIKPQRDKWSDGIAVSWWPRLIIYGTTIFDTLLRHILNMRRYSFRLYSLWRWPRAKIYLEQKPVLVDLSGSMNHIIREWIRDIVMHSIVYKCLKACDRHGPLARYIKLRMRMRRECRERFPHHRG